VELPEPVESGSYHPGVISTRRPPGGFESTFSQPAALSAHAYRKLTELPSIQGSGGNRRRTRYTNDDSGRVLQVLSKISIYQEQMRARFEYDGRSNIKKLARLKNAVEKSHQFSYDDLNRPTQALDPLSRASSIAWAPFYREHTATDAKGIQTTYSRDSLCRLVEIRNLEELRVLDYDEPGRLISVEQTHNPEARYSTDLPRRSAVGR
jgi:YD repeat-containing protein